MLQSDRFGLLPLQKIRFEKPLFAQFPYQLCLNMANGGVKLVKDFISTI